MNGPLYSKRARVVLKRFISNSWSHTVRADSERWGSRLCSASTKDIYFKEHLILTEAVMKSIAVLRIWALFLLRCESGSRSDFSLWRGSRSKLKYYADLERIFAKIACGKCTKINKPWQNFSATCNTNGPFVENNFQFWCHSGSFVQNYLFWRKCLSEKNFACKNTVCVRQEQMRGRLEKFSWFSKF